MLNRHGANMIAGLVLISFAPTAGAQKAQTYSLSEAMAAKIAAAAPDAAPAKPTKPRKVLVYGRERTHPESVVSCAYAMEQIAKRSGAFEVVVSGDPAVFLPDSLARFDAVVMNNTHERFPLRPVDFNSLDGAKKKDALEREERLKKSLLDFVANGKGLVGIHGATAGNVQWPEYLEMLNGTFGGVMFKKFSFVPVDPDHPLTTPFGGKSLEVDDEFYLFRAPYDPKRATILLRLDLSKTPAPTRKDVQWAADFDAIATDYPLSWIRTEGKGRVFYCALGHKVGVYATPAVLEHYLAGIQWAIGDLELAPNAK